jgi:hypothetical protein
MSDQAYYQRPPFSEALKVWESLLEQRGLPVQCVWVFEENLIHEKASGASGFHLSFQTVFTPPPSDSAHVAFDEFRGQSVPIVFHRVGSNRNRSVCMILADDWFKTKGEKDGFVRRSDWGVSFYPGEAGEIEDVTDDQRWKKRVIRGRPLDATDFCMTLRTIHEILAHGRALTSYEHYALRLLHRWKQFLKR